MKALRGAGAALLAFGLASCASRPPVRTAEPAPMITLPVLAAQPGAMDINKGLSSGEMLWHLRAALNVAALACQDAAHAAVAAQYNALLQNQRAALSAAHDAEEAHFRQQYGAAWQDAFDHHQTKLYNLFADPRATHGLCDQAMTVAAELNGAAPAQVEALAGKALAQIEQPFLAAMAPPPGAPPLALNALPQDASLAGTPR